MTVELCRIGLHRRRRDECRRRAELLQYAVPGRPLRRRRETHSAADVRDAFPRRRLFRRRERRERRRARRENRSEREAGKTRRRRVQTRGVCGRKRGIRGYRGKDTRLVSVRFRSVRGAARRRQKKVPLPRVTVRPLADVFRVWRAERLGSFDNSGLPPDHRREPREAPGDARAKPLVPAVALDGVHDAPLFLNREPRARAVVVEHVERVRLRGVVEHDGRVDVAPLAFVRYARDAEPPPEPGVHGRARELPRRDQGSLVLVSPATVYAIRRVPAPAPAVAPAAAAAAATAAPRTRHPPSRHEASTFGEARRDRK